VDRLDLDVPAGAIVGLAGADGAGKTTTVECIQGLRRPDAGLLGILGDEPRRAGPLLEPLLLQHPVQRGDLDRAICLGRPADRHPRRRDLRKRSWGRPRPTAGRRSPAQRTACGGWCSLSAPASWPWDCSAPGAGPPAPPGGRPPCSTVTRRAAPSSAVPGLGKNIWTVPIVCTQHAMSRGAT